MEIVLDTPSGMFAACAGQGRTALGISILKDVRETHGIADVGALTAIGTMRTTMYELKGRLEQSVVENKRVFADPSDFKRLCAEQAYVEKTVINLAKRVGDLEGAGSYTPDQLAALRNKHTVSIDTDLPFMADFYLAVTKELANTNINTKKIKHK